ncbi:MAG: DUF6019 family protein [Acutalibacteraceae bacterium]|nr:DUF6019 family protein [Acutalibacteraceae bacterium]
MDILQDLGISSGTAIIVLIALYFVIKYAVKNGIKEAYKDIKNNKLDTWLDEDENEEE